MDKNEIREIIKQNGKDYKSEIVMLFIASLFALASAIYGAFRFGKKKGKNAERSTETGKAFKSDVKRTKKTRRKLKKTDVSKENHTRSASKKSTGTQSGETADETIAAPATVIYKYVTPQPVYVVNPLQEKKRESRGRRFTRHMCGAAAAILLITMVGSTAMQSVETTTAMAKESFSGIGEIVKDHDGDDPYIILDVVPADAVYSDEFIFSIGTMGYLVNGQASISKSIENIFKNKKETFYDYDARKDLIDDIILSDNTLGVKYEEAYGGVDTIPEHAGWIQIFGETGVSGVNDYFVDGYADGDIGDDADGNGDDDGTVEDDDSSTGILTYATGRFYGKAELYDDSGDRTGYDYVAKNAKISLLSNTRGLSVGSEGDIYIHDNSEKGEYHVQFGFDRVAGSEETTGGYVASPVECLTDAEGSYSLTTGVYVLKDGVYEYRCTIAEILGVADEYNIVGGDDEEEEIPEEIPETPEEEENPGEIPEIPDETPEEEEEDAEETPTTPETPEEEEEDAEETPAAPETPEEEEKEENNEEAPAALDSTPAEPGPEARYTGYIASEGSLIASNSPSFGNWQRFVYDDEELHQRWQDTIGSGGYEDYWIVSFQHKDSTELTEEMKLYKVDNTVKITNKNAPKPFDSYKEGTKDEKSVVPEGSENPEDLENSVATLDLPAGREIIVPYANEENSATGLEFVYIGPGKGDFKLTRTNKETGDLIEVQRAPVYFRCTTNKDWIKEYVFCTLSGGDNKNDDFEIEVITKRADEVDAYDVKNADLIFLESEVNNVVLNTGDTGNLELKYINSDDSGYPDMPDAAAAQILRSAVDDLKPVIVDYDIVDSKNYGEKSTYQYLAKAFLKEDLEEFVDKMDRDGELIANLKTNANVEDTKDSPHKKENDYNYVNRNVYIVNDDTPLVSEDFRDYFDKTKSKEGFSDVLNTIWGENNTLSDDDKISHQDQASKARAVQYIINYSIGIVGEFEDLKILEIQPSANNGEPDLYQEDGKKLGWKTESMTKAKPIISNKKEFDVDIDVKSVVEFNGEWEDINGKYDMIFIGLDGRTLNLDEDGRTVYNDKERLNGKVYHKGDNSDSGLGKYDANDLTAQKMEELWDFMEAGYPVVVEDNCFEKHSAQKSGKDGIKINHAYIEEGSVMDYFLQRAVGEYPYYNHIFSVSDVAGNAMFMTQVRFSKPRISLMGEDGEKASRLLLLPLDENGEYHGQIYYKIENNRGEKYVGNGDPVVKVYADYNYDGYFIPSEEVTEFVDDGSMLDIRIDGMGPGILPYKIEVSDAGNAYRRSSVQGYFYLGITSDDEMKVLQITEKKNTDMQKGNAVDLQWMFNTVENSVLAYWLRSAEANYGMEMLFETVTSSELEKELDSNAKYLEQYDVVVLTLDDAAESSAVAEAINQYVGNGRSLLVCGQDPGDRRAGLDKTLLGQTDDRTFVHIGKNGSGGQYLRYAGNGDMFSSKTGLKAEQINDGIISLYPYTIDSSFTFGNSEIMKAAPYLLDFDNNLKTESETNPKVTVWYTFGSNDGKGSAYGISPKDARNNYYCYSRGNVIYLAQSEYAYYMSNGQSQPSQGDAGYNECRFFVNALFAAYSAGLHNAHINIVSGFAPDSADIESISVPFDETWLEASDEATIATGGILDNTVDVFFKFRDSNIAAQKTTLVGFYRQASAGEDGDPLNVNGKEVIGVSFHPEEYGGVWTVNDENNRLMKIGDELQPGKIYRVKAPVITLRNLRGNNDTEDKADIYIVLETTFRRNGQEYTITTADAVSLNRARLFRLE